MVANSRTHDATPNVDRPVRPSDTPCGFGQKPAGSHTLVASSNLRVLGFETPTVIELAYWTGLECCRGPSDRSGAIREPTHGRKEIAHPLCRATLNPSAGSKVSRTAQIVRLNRAPNKGYVHPRALGAGRLLGRARGSKGQHHLGRCGCCAAHTNMAHDMARSSWCPTGHL